MKLSIIVCTRNRSHAILPCLDSLAQSLAYAAPVDAEIVVVDNGSTDNTASVVRGWAAKSPFPVQVILEPRPGQCYARNCGIRAARGELLAWTDDDCRVSKQYVADLVKHDGTDTELVLRGGRVELGDPTDLPLSIKTHNVSQRWHKQRDPQKAGDLITALIGANMTMRRALVERVGLFDERFGPGSSLPGGDDIDYIYRAYLAGAIVEYVPDMVVFHHHGRKTVPVGNRLVRNYVTACGGLYAKYIFKHFDFCRPVYWTLRSAIRETIAGEKKSKDEVALSSRGVLGYSMLGAMRYTAVSMRQLIGI
jgi:glycosyltransferase involved in cell wall biosynthesis